MSSWILIFVAAVDCVACVHYKKEWPKYKAAIQAALSSKIIIEEIELPKRSVATLDTKKFPLALTYAISWFPTFILVEKNHFNEVKMNSSKRLVASVFNGIAPDDPMLQVVFVGKEKRLPPNDKNLIAWIEHEIANPPSYDVSSKASIPPLPRIPTQGQLSAIQEPSLPVCGRYRLKSKYK